MKEVENDKRRSKMMKMMSVMKNEDLDDSDETVFSICNCLWRDYMDKLNWPICDICDVRNISARY